MGKRKAEKAGTDVPMVSSDLNVKTAWLYYVEGPPQEQIPEKPGARPVQGCRTLATWPPQGAVSPPPCRTPGRGPRVPWTPP